MNNFRNRKVLHVITGMTIGGAQQILVHSLPKIRAQGYSVEVIGLYPGQLSDELVKEGIPVNELQMKSVWDLKILWQLIRKIRQIGPDIVHTHLGKADAYGRVAARVVGVPVVVSTVHNVEQWKNNIFYRYIDAVTARLANRLICCSQLVADNVRHLNVQPGNKITVIPNAIDLDKFREAPLTLNRTGFKAEFGLENNDYVIMAVGRLEEQKGFEYLIKSMLTVVMKHRMVKAIILGSGSQENHLKNLINEYGLQKNVMLGGPRRDIYDVLQYAHLFVLPSLWEGIPIALLEAMASKKTVVASAVGGVPEVIRNLQNGILIAPGNSDELTDAIIKCYSNCELARSLADKAYFDVTQFYSIENYTRQTVMLYDRLLNQMITH